MSININNFIKVFLLIGFFMKKNYYKSHFRLFNIYPKEKNDSGKRYYSSAITGK